MFDTPARRRGLTMVLTIGFGLVILPTLSFAQG